jgi:hypothetical protein
MNDNKRKVSNYRRKGLRIASVWGRLKQGQEPLAEGGWKLINECADVIMWQCGKVEPKFISRLSNYYVHHFFSNFYHFFLIFTLN